MGAPSRDGLAGADAPEPFGLGPLGGIPSAEDIASALRLKLLMDSIDAAGGKITVMFPEEGAEQ